MSTPHPTHDFDAIYAVGAPAWDIGRPQPAFEHVAKSGDLSGRVLDAGCGTGEHALIAASLGYEAAGVDMSVRATELAKTKATERGVDVRSSSQMPFASLIWVSGSTQCSTVASSTSWRRPAV
jgi:methylase of polypeptide subunit release factors